MIKIRVGQVWERNGNFNKITRRVTFVDDNWVQVFNPPRKRKIPIHRFWHFYKFIPKNDLEWLSVNCDEWKSNSVEHNIHKDGDSVYYVDYRYQHDSYTRQQWQNMRYYLGLDTKPHYEFYNGHWSETK